MFRGGRFRNGDERAPCGSVLHHHQREEVHGNSSIEREQRRAGDIDAADAAERGSDCSGGLYIQELNEYDEHLPDH